MAERVLDVRELPAPEPFERIVAALDAAILDDQTRARMCSGANPYGDGRAADRVVLQAVEGDVRILEREGLVDQTARRDDRRLSRLEQALAKVAPTEAAVGEGQDAGRGGTDRRAQGHALPLAGADVVVRIGGVRPRAEHELTAAATIVVPPDGSSPTETWSVRMT